MTRGGVVVMALKCATGKTEGGRVIGEMLAWGVGTGAMTGVGGVSPTVRSMCLVKTTPVGLSMTCIQVGQWTSGSGRAVRAYT